MENFKEVSIRRGCNGAGYEIKGMELFGHVVLNKVRESRLLNLQHNLTKP